MSDFSKIINDDEVIKLIRPFLSGVKSYIVGGYVRDLLTGKHSSDIDLTVFNTDVKRFSVDLADKIRGYYIELDAVNNIHRVVFEDKIHYLDIAAPLGNDLELDLTRRDLTINAVAYDVNNNDFIDVTGGLEDIKNHVIRGIREENFTDDPLRLLRIFRFYAKTGFKIDAELVLLAKKYSPLINRPAKERINIELLKLFEGKYAGEALKKLDECNILEHIFPVYSEVKKIPPNTHHHLPLFYHLIETVNQIQIYYENSQGEVKEYLNECTFASVANIAFLKLAGFLHDIGKPSCWTIEEDTGRHRFIGHDNIGAEMVVPILKGLKFSKKQTELISNLIKYHIYPSSMISSEGITDKTIMKFYRKTDGFVIPVIILAMADRLSARGPAVSDKIVKQNISDLTSLLNNYLEKRPEMKPLPKLIDGNEIMQILNVKGPELGKVIRDLKEAQISSEVITKEDAVYFLKKNLKKC